MSRLESLIELDRAGEHRNGARPERHHRAQTAEEALAQQRDWLEVTLTSIGDAVITTDTEVPSPFSIVQQKRSQVGLPRNPLDTLSTRCSALFMKIPDRLLKIRRSLCCGRVG